MMTQSISLFDMPTEPIEHAEVEIFDPPMCCPTGLCGPALDQTLLDVNEMILTLKASGVRVERYQMTSHPNAFLSAAAVMHLVREKQMEALPITLVRGRVLATGAYPTLSAVQAALADEVQS
jgi:hypothetical protein